VETVYITRRETFNAAHKLYRPDWSEEKNEEVFGKCSNKNWHGHNFVLFVTVKGIPSADTGFVMNLKDLSTLLKEAVIWNRIEGQIRERGGELAKIKLVETENNYVEYYGGKEPF
jgi:6-pyruvoyltetrahydropterin/6-carboxytetrahydropterin synthase